MRPRRDERYRAEAKAAAENTDWHDRAVCRIEQVPTAVFFADNTTPAKAYCARCPVARKCNLAAVHRQEAGGVWGGRSRTKPRPRVDRQSDDEIAVAVLYLVRMIAAEVGAA